MVALLCIVISLAAIECSLLSGHDHKLYNPVSLGTTVAAALLLTLISIQSGWMAAAHFTLTYLALSCGFLLLNLSLYSRETTFIPILSSIVLVAELALLILPAQLILSLF